MKTIFTLSLLLVNTLLIGQFQELNLDFELLTIDNFAKNWRENNDGFKFQVENQNVKSGKYAISAVRTNLTTPYYAQIFQTLDKPKFKHIQFSGYILTKDKGNAYLAINADGKIFASKKSHTSNRFEYTEIEANIKSDTKEVTILCVAESEATFDHLRVIIDGQEYGIAQNKLESIFEKNLLNSSTPLDSTIHILDSQMTKINSRFFGIGEGTHGTKEFHEIQLNLSKKLIKSYECQNIFIEANYYDIWHINKYIQNTADDFNISDLNYWIWKNEEFSNFIKWLRVYNLNNQHKVEIIGYDIMDYGRAVKTLKEYALENDQNLLKKLKDIESKIVAIEDVQSGISKATKKPLKILGSIDKKVLSRLDENCRIALWILNQYCKIIANPNPDLREKLMLENLKYFDDGISKHIILAHNTHITSLKKVFNKSMHSFITLTANGNYIANGSYLDFKVQNKQKLLRTFELTSPTRGDCEYYLNQLFDSNTLVNIKKSKYVIELIKSTHYRDIGSIKPLVEFVNYDTPEINDYLIFIPNSTPSKTIN